MSALITLRPILLYVYLIYLVLPNEIYPLADHLKIRTE